MSSPASRAIAEAPRAAFTTRAANASRTAAIDWLAPSRAFDIGFDGDPGCCQAGLRRAYRMIGLLDLNILPLENRRKAPARRDMDSTIIGCECIDELADMAGLKPQVAAITERAMRGELDFPSALPRNASRC